MVTKTVSLAHFCRKMQNDAVEAYWAHNPEVRGSKPRSASFCKLEA